MSEYAENRRADRAAEAEQRRIDRAAADALRVERVRAADERAARLREQQRVEKAAARKARAERRTELGASLTAGNVYRKGTLALVAASGLGSLPAQVLHFVSISPMLLPLPLAIEGAAWVMAAGVAYADERHLPGWVRWFLRGLVVAAAGFAASVNYDYGTHLSGLSVSDARAAGVGLAAVTLLGPMLFEIRQWVTTLSAASGDAQDRARRKHDRTRRRQHRSVARLADRLVSAAPFDEMSFEDAFAHAWEIETGTATPGMTPKLHRRAARSTAALVQAQHPSAPQSRARTWWGRRDRDTVAPVPALVPHPAEGAPNTVPEVTGTPLPVPAQPVAPAMPSALVICGDQRVWSLAVPSPEVDEEVTGDEGGRLPTGAAATVIRACWMTGTSIADAARQATRSTSYVKKVFARMEADRGPQPSPGQLALVPSEASA
ncbi:hypothetical protein PUR34_34980 [Streptomyces sp. JV185]|uniref:hypothetical protein n=1 Tax=Streptomyces sp. JV185 TaxID=858638 RepID=UPI002E7A3BE0|nr:hypothetical protein [Streptomyces sp. JV185]MEE1773232.1 hypothetical protein [Streptomyces sp. JV185]